LESGYRGSYGFFWVLEEQSSYEQSVSEFPVLSIGST